MGRYAEDTNVSSDKSRAEIERTLVKYGATSFGYMWDAGAAVIQFTAENRRVRFTLPMPSREDEEYVLTPTGRERSEAQAYAAWEQGVRQRWRALALAVKAKLEAVDAGITTFEEEFMAHIVMPNQKTVGQNIKKQIFEAYDSGKMPQRMLTEGG